MQDQQSAEDFSRHRAAATAELHERMRALSMREEDGWRIVEFLRDTRGGTELVLRPIHTWLQTPPDLECVVWVRDEEGVVQSTCDPAVVERG